MGEGCLMIAPIGILTIAAALFCLLLGNGATVRILSVSAVLGSAAALLVGAKIATALIIAAARS